MNPRENVIALYKREKHDYNPIRFDLCPSLNEEYKKRLNTNIDCNEYYEFPEVRVNDLKHIPVEDEYYFSFLDKVHEKATVTTFGVVNEPGSEACKHMTYMRHPMEKLETMKEFENYKYPIFLPEKSQHIEREVKAIQKKGYAAKATMACTIWEAAWYMRGMEQLMMDMVEEEETAVYHFDRITEIACLRAKTFAKAGVDVILTGDDIGMQSSIMMSVDMWKKWIKPRFKKVIEAAKSVNKDVVLEYHSCGFVEPFIPHLIEIGVDVLNPVQPECMSFEKLYKEYGGNLSFTGTIGTQTTMPFGSEKEIKEEVYKNLSIAKEKGGLFCMPTHLLEPEVPYENIEAYIEAVKSFK